MSVEFKLRLYLETTVFNWYYDERPEHDEVMSLFEAIRNGKFAGYTSKYVTEELEKAPDPKRTNMMNLLDEFGIMVLPPHADGLSLAKEYRDAEIIPHSQVYDSLHVAVASLYDIDVIVSYNFQHINKDKVRALVPGVNADRGLSKIVILTAKEVFDYVEFFRE